MLLEHVAASLRRECVDEDSEKSVEDPFVVGTVRSVSGST